MEGLKYIVVLCLLLVAVFVWFQETQRYDFCFDECSEQFNKDVSLLNEGICLNANTRLRFQQLVDCEGAEKRVRIMPRDCAWHKWRSESQLMHLYVLLTGSYWSLTMFVLPLCMFGMWLRSRESQHGQWIDLARQKERRKRKQLKQLGFDNGIMKLHY